jgi:hypothetical protein
VTHFLIYPTSTQIEKGRGDEHIFIDFYDFLNPYESRVNCNVKCDEMHLLLRYCVVAQ